MRQKMSHTTLTIPPSHRQAQVREASSAGLVLGFKGVVAFTLSLGDRAEEHLSEALPVADLLTAHERLHRIPPYESRRSILQCQRSTPLDAIQQTHGNIARWKGGGGRGATGVEVVAEKEEGDGRGTDEQRRAS